MAKRDKYTTPASKQGMTSHDLVMQRLHKLQELMQRGKRIQDTTMTRAFIDAVQS